MNSKIFHGLALASGLGLVAALAPVAGHAQGYRDRVTCGSVDGRFARCDVGWRDADLVRQDSDARCVRGQTWGFDRGAIWVDRGCRGQFVPARGGWGGGDGRPGWGGGGDRDVSIQCGSVDNRYRLCPVRIGRDADVRLVNNDSDTRCREGYNWGVQRDGIWVDRGCRGRFVISQRW